MKRTSIRSKDVAMELSPYINLTKKDTIELLEDEHYKILLINKQPSFFSYKNKWIPLLKLLLQRIVLKKITIDMGAVKFIINGADVMRPGITHIEENIHKNDPIVIVDQNNQKPLAVGIALIDSTEMQNAKNGKVIKNIHYVGDELWKFEI